MTIDFGPQRWQKIKEDWGLWWAGKLKRPLISVVVDGMPTDRPAPPTPSPSRGVTAYDLAVTPEAMVERWDYDLAQTRWLGDAFPCLDVDFGPGAMAGFLGARPEPGVDTVWFHPSRPQPVTELQLTYDARSVWFNRVKEVYRLGMERWQGRALMAMTDLGGNLDVLSTFLPSEQLLLDLYDHPEDVKRLTAQEHELWWRYFAELNAILQPRNPGYSCWAQMYSEIPYYMLQCDFAYMLGPDMFAEFVLPELTATCKRLGNAFYHLDGVGQLAHLDTLLTIPELKGIQWVPGDGKPPQCEWPDVLKKVRDAGKLLQFWGKPADIDAVARNLGTLEGTVWLCWANPDNAREYEECMRRHGVGR